MEDLQSLDHAEDSHRLLWLVRCLSAGEAAFDSISLLVLKSVKETATRTAFAAAVIVDCPAFVGSPSAGRRKLIVRGSRWRCHCFWMWFGVC